MEDYNDMKKITGSPTAGVSEFVHVEPIDSAPMNGNSINQDDGIMVTRVDTIQLKPDDQQLTEDGGNEEFVDCPDDLISLDGRSDFDENTETELVLEDQQTNGGSTEILPHHYEEEKRQLMAEITELTNIRHQLLIEQSQKDDTIRKIYANLDLKDREIEDLDIKSSRILTIFTTVFGDEEFPDTSVSGKLSHIEKKTSFMIQKYNHFLYEVEMVNQCLTEVKSDYHIQPEMEKVLFFVREELISLRRKEFELAHKSKYLENEYGKLMQELVKTNETVDMLKGEVEVHNTKFINTKEKLNLAVTKGKSLVQQRDSLKKAIFEKTDELNKSLIDLQEKSRDLEAANSLKESLLESDIILKKCEEILTFGEVQGPNLESRVSWLLESLNIAKNESIRVQSEINTIKEAARVEIDRLMVSLLVESQEKNYLEQEFANLKGENGSLKNHLKRFEDKTVLLREKLSMAVKKGKSLVQERAEKNAQIEALKLELKNQEITINDCRDQISRLSKDVGRIEKLEYDLLCLKEENNQIEPLKLQLKQQEATINDYKDQISKLSKDVGQIEKLESDILCLKEENNQIEVLKRELEQKEATINDYRDQNNKVSKDVSRIENLESDILCLKEENSQIETLKLELKQQEVTINDYRDQISKLSKDVGRIENLESDLLCLKEENNQIEALKLELKQQEATINDYRDQISRLSKDIEKLESCILCLKEENNQIEALKLELKQQEATINDYRDLLSKLSKDVGRIANLESNLLCLKEENNQIEALKLELKQKEATINDYRDQNSKLSKDVGRIENLESDILCLKEENSQIEALKLELEHQEATINDYRDQISKLSKDVGRTEKLEYDLLCLKEENSQIEALKLELKQQEATINDYRDQISKLPKDVGQIEKLESDILCLKEENNQIEALKLELKQQEATINDYRDQISKLSKDVGRIEILESDMLCFKEENNQIEPLKLELKQQEATVNDYRDQISKLSKDIEKLESSILCLKEENNQIEALKLELKQQEATVNDYRDQNSKLSKDVGRIEKLGSDLLCLKEENNQIKLAKAKSDHELRVLKDETDMLTRKLTDALSVSKKHVFQLTEENKELKFIRTNTEEELQKVKEKENDVKVLHSACADVTKEMKSILEKLNHNSSLDVGTVDDVAVADNKVVEEMMFASRNVQSVIEHCFDEKQNMSATIKDLQVELEKNKSTYEKVKEEIEELQNVRDEMNTKLLEYQAKEAELSKQITTFVKDYEAENDLQSTISKQTLEIKHLKQEFEEAVSYKTEFEKMKKELFELSVGVEHIIRKFGGYESDADVAGLVPVLERFISEIILDSENSKGKAKEFGVKLLDTQKVVEELENKIKLFEDINKNQKIDSIREVGDSERSEISEVEDSGSLGKRAIPLVRTLKRETNDQHVLNIDSESDHLINKHESVEDKGHVFKSLHTSGLVPPQGKIIADRLDGLWVSGGGALMSRPRARLGLIAYWAVLHLWLLGTLL